NSRRQRRARPLSLHHRHRREARDRRALAELAVSVIAPAVRAGAGLHAPAHVVPPGPHGGEVEPTGYRDGTALGNGRPVAKLTVPVLAPAVCRTADRHATAEVAARVHHGEAQPAGDACRHRAWVVVPSPSWPQTL